MGQSFFYFFPDRAIRFFLPQICHSIQRLHDHEPPEYEQLDGTHHQGTGVPAAGSVPTLQDSTV